jgi:hypothetical protein
MKIDILVTCGFLFFGPCGMNAEAATPADCIHPPPTVSKDDLEIATKIEAKLKVLSLDPSVEAKFKKALETDYGTLNDRQVEYYMFLQAIECFSKDPSNPIQSDLAKQLTVLVVEKFRKDYGVQGGGRKLALAERGILKQSPEGDYILSSLSKYGY